MINNKTILITGGTGSFGHTVTEKILNDFNPKKIIIYSRDEKKQYDMRIKFKNHENITFMIGDVRDRNQVYKALKGVDIIFHAAALKQVPNCEFYPYEAVQTNIIGTQNVLDAAEDNEIEKVVVLSTDKAVYPINAMGISKAMLEKLMLAKARLTATKTVFCGVRYGNVMYSRGSVIPLFIEQMKKNISLTITYPGMTRYLLPLPVAIDLVLFALSEGQNGDVLVRKSPASTMKTLAEVLIEMFNYKHGYKVIGIREGEKLHETLVTQEDLLKAESYENYYRIKNLEQIDYDLFFTKGEFDKFPKEGYTSENTRRLTHAQTKELLLSLIEIQIELKHLKK